jgi:hypothetical protein
MVLDIAPGGSRKRRQHALGAANLETRNNMQYAQRHHR